MKEYLLQRLGISDTRKSTTALNSTVQLGWTPIHFFRTVQGDIGVVFEKEATPPAPVKKVRKPQQEEEKSKSLVDELDEIIQDPELVDGLRDLLS